jgi:hypothetical protein
VERIWFLSVTVLTAEARFRFRSAAGAEEEDADGLGRRAAGARRGWPPCAIAGTLGRGEEEYVCGGEWLWGSSVLLGRVGFVSELE